jgi:hypothetical protein
MAKSHKGTNTRMESNTTAALISVPHLVVERLQLAASHAKVSIGAITITVPATRMFLSIYGIAKAGVGTVRRQKRHSRRAK